MKNRKLRNRRKYRNKQMELMKNKQREKIKNKKIYKERDEN